MKNVTVRSLISQLSILVAWCLLLAAPAVSQTAIIQGYVKDVDTTAAIMNVDVCACDTEPCLLREHWTCDITDNTGLYVITGLVDSQDYKVKFFTTLAPPYVPEWYEDKYSIASADWVTALDSGTTLNPAFLEPGSEITGKVVDTNNVPIANATVFVRDGDEWITSTTTTGTLDGNGNNYTLTGLSQNRDYHIYFYADNIGYPDEWYDDQEPIDGTHTVTAGATTVNGGATRIDVTLGVFETSSFNWLLFLPTIVHNSITP